MQRRVAGGAAGVAQLVAHEYYPRRSATGRSGVSTTRSSLGDGGGGDVYGNREAAEAQKWFRAAGPARYESPPPARPRV